MRDLGLPAQPVLPEDLRLDGEGAAALEQARADDDLGPEDGLVVVDVGGAVGAVVAVHGLACTQGQGLQRRCFFALFLSSGCGGGWVVVGELEGKVGKTRRNRWIDM